MAAKRIILGASLLALAHHAAAAQTAVDAQGSSYVTGYSASWLAQIGDTTAIETEANGGTGFKLGFVDTGVVPTQSDVTGRVSSLSSCAAVTFACSNGYVDDNGHGTSTAAIGAGATYSNGSGMMGVAPNATIIEEKVLNASGSGYDTDVANGITKAVNAGAMVINLSLTYTPTTAVINAINYAASKGAIIVYAGGNSSQALNGGVNTTGYTTAALSHLVFVGSVSANDVLSSFSNTPGTGYAVAGTTKDSFASLWLMAPGENIIAPCVAACYTQLHSTFAYWTGTSMAAPMVAGALALLETTWPVLERNSTATQVLFDTATLLGKGGVNSTYGNGLLNLTRAFQPIGSTYVIAANGNDILTSQLTATTLTSGALGSLSAITPLLSNYTDFDSFQRNFTINLSGLLNHAVASGLTIASALPPVVTTSTTHLNDGGLMSTTIAAMDDVALGTSPGADGIAAIRNAGPDYNGELTGQWMMTFSNGMGSDVTVGHGFPAAASFASALWGSQSFAAGAAYDLQGTSDLINLASGGHFFAFGTEINDATRFGLALSQSGASDYSAIPGNILFPKADAASLGLSSELAPGVSAGVTVSLLDESYGLLGSLYTPNSAVSLGNDHQSASFGLAAAFALGPNTGLLLNGSIVETSGATPGGLIDAITPVTARSYGASLVQQNLFDDGDRFSLSVIKPLRAFDGSIDVTTTTVDAEGYSHTGFTALPVAPGGDETDFAVGYSKFWQMANFSASLEYQSDEGNLPGVNAVEARFGADVRF